MVGIVEGQLYFFSPLNQEIHFTLLIGPLILLLVSSTCLAYSLYFVSTPIYVCLWHCLLSLKRSFHIHVLGWFFGCEKSIHCPYHMIPVPDVGSGILNGCKASSRFKRGRNCFTLDKRVVATPTSDTIIITSLLCPLRTSSAPTALTVL